MINKKLTLTVDNESISPYTTLLQSGVELLIPANISLGVMLSSLPGFDMDYIVNRIETIFLDGNAIDDLETTLVKDNHVLALSAAMPGLAGAIFRKNSFIAALRANKTEHGPEQKKNQNLSIKIKLFNMIAREKGPLLLQQGAVIAGKSLIDFFSTRDSLIDTTVRCSLENKPIANSALISHLSPEDSYTVVIHAE